jgi:hypothetical protein
MTALRLSILAASLALAGCHTASRPEPAHAPVIEPVRAVEWTFLKSNPGDRDRLRQFIILNWFALDARAKAEGLMLSYRVLDSGDDADPWNLAVEVIYPDARGSDAIMTRFNQLRAEHTKVLIDGKDLKDLGRIVGSRRVFERDQ